jgi:lysophospholipase L1-like esterase
MVRTILCYGDSNTWGYSPENGERLAPGERWPGVLGGRLGASARVVEEGLNGRTSVFDVPGEPILNGRPFLPVCLASQAPIDVVVIYLGTNDVWLPSVSAIDAAVGVGELAGIVAESESGPGSAAPGVLVVVPPPFAETADDEPGAPEALAASVQFSEAFAAMAAGRGLDLLDLRGVAESSPLDGVHFDAANHRAIGEAVAAALSR